MSSRPSTAPNAASNTPSTAERIVEGALRAAENHGVRRLTMDEIAKHAGVARVTIYTHFPNKDAILSAVVERELGALIASVSVDVADDEDATARCLRMFAEAYETLRDNALLQRLVSTEPETILPYAAYDSPFLMLGRQWLAAELSMIFAVESGGRPAGDYEDAAELVVRVIQSLVFSPVSVYDLNDRASIQALARRWLLPVIESLNIRTHQS